MAQLNNVGCYLGEAIALTFTIKPLTDITGWTIKLTIKNNATDVGQLLQVAAVLTTPASGIFTCSLTHAQTLTLGVGTYAYDVQRTDSGSEAVLSIGSLTVSQEVLY